MLYFQVANDEEQCRVNRPLLPDILQSHVEKHYPFPLTDPLM